MSICIVVLILFSQVTIQWSESDVYVQPPVQGDSCKPLALPPPPSPVLNVTLSELTFPDDNIQFVFHWKPPVTTNGHVTHYVACLGGRKLSQFEEYNPQSAASDENDITCITIKTVSMLIVIVTSFQCDNNVPFPLILSIHAIKFTQHFFRLKKPMPPGISELLAHSVSTFKYYTILYSPTI